MNLGFVGLGRMGGGMALRLVEAGHPVTVYDVAPGAADTLVAGGAARAASVGEACAARALVITMLVEDGALLDVALSAGGIRESLPRDAIHIAMGTHGVDAIDALTEAHHAAGQRFIAAPVLGRPDMAARGQLGIVAGGPEDATRDSRPVLDQLGRRVFAAGAQPSSATAIKLANNHVLGCALVSMAEAFSLVRRCGASPKAFYDFFTAAGLDGAAYTGYGRTMMDETFDRVGSPVTVGLKDALLIRAAAERVAVPMPSQNVYRDRLLGALAHGDGGRDQAVLAREQNRAAGLDGGEPPRLIATSGKVTDDASARLALETLRRLLEALGRADRSADDADVTVRALAYAGLAACALEAMAEAFALVRRYGVDPQVLLDVMTDGLFGTDGVHRLFGAEMISGTPPPGAVVTAAEAQRLVGLVLGLAGEARVPMPSVDVCRDRLLGAVARGHGPRSWTVVYEEQMLASGLI